jgi:hypothetical protein
LAVLICYADLKLLPGLEDQLNYIRWFGEIGVSDVAKVGGKGANLGELNRAGEGR